MAWNNGCTCTIDLMENGNKVVIQTFNVRIQSYACHVTAHMILAEIQEMYETALLIYIPHRKFYPKSLMSPNNEVTLAGYIFFSICEL
jgi:hypothetical protein